MADNMKILFEKIDKYFQIIAEEIFKRNVKLVDHISIEK